ncbi:MAG: outer membrane beta-barrel protein [Pseudomonadota bacterium]
MKRALPLFVLASASVLSAHAVAGPSIIGSVYMPTIETDGFPDAEPDGLTLELRAPLNKNFWIGGLLATTLSSDTVLGTDVELGASFAVNLGVQAEFAHHVSGYAYLGYGAAKVLTDDPILQDVDGKSVAWGAGVQFLLGDHLLVDAGYASLFDDEMEGDAGVSGDVAIAGPRVGLGFKF